MGRPLEVRISVGEGGSGRDFGPAPHARMRGDRRLGDGEGVVVDPAAEVGLDDGGAGHGGAVPPEQLKPPVNVLRLSLHPDGLSPWIVNLAEWRAHLLERLRHQIEVSGDPVLAELMRELDGYLVATGESAERVSGSAVVVPLRLRHGDHILDLISTTTVFGTPVEITLSELAIESFFPANAETTEVLQALGSA